MMEGRQAQTQTRFKMISIAPFQEWLCNLSICFYTPLFSAGTGVVRRTVVGLQWDGNTMNLKQMGIGVDSYEHMAAANNFPWNRRQ